MSMSILFYACTYVSVCVLLGVSHCVALGPMDVQDLGLMDHGPMVHLDNIEPWSEVTQRAAQCALSTACTLCRTHVCVHASLSQLSSTRMHAIPCATVDMHKLMHCLSVHIPSNSCTRVQLAIDHPSAPLLPVVPLPEPELSPPLHEVVMHPSKVVASNPSCSFTSSTYAHMDTRAGQPGLEGILGICALDPAPKQLHGG